MLDVIGIGSAFVDYFIEADQKFFKKYNLKVEDDFLFEEKNIRPASFFKENQILAKSPGGNSPNTIAVLAKLGAKVGYHGIIGKNDKNSSFFLKKLKKIDFHVFKKGKMSKAACIVSHNRKYRTFLSEVNKYDNYFFQKIDYLFLNLASFVYIGPFYLNPKENIEKLKKVFENIEKPLICFSPGIVYLEFNDKNIIPLLKKTHVFFLNSQEIKTMTKKTVKEGSKKLLEFGPKIIVCTLGGKGVLITSSKEQFYTKAKKVKKIIDTTGAGDAFAAGFLYGLIKKKSLRWSANFGNKIASYSISGFGLSWLKSLVI